MATPLVAPRAGESAAARQGASAALAERRGETKIARPPGPLIWAHGASVGEMLAVVPLVEGLRARNFNVLVTSGTVTSARLAERRLPPGAIHQFIPLDAPRYTARFLEHWQPNLALLAESDLWPNLIMTCDGEEHAADPGQRPLVRALVHALALFAEHHRRAARSLRSVPGAIRAATPNAIPISARRA